MPNGQDLSHAAGNCRQPETRSENCLSRHSFRAEAEPAEPAVAPVLLGINFVSTICSSLLH
jgi:hypothetical protein